MVVQSKLAERSQLLSQLDQAKMQEQVSASMASMSELTASGTTPSLNEVREKIEARYARALGSAELASNSVEGRMLEVQRSTLDMAGASRLDQIRASLGGGQVAAPPLGTGSATPSLDKGTSTPDATPQGTTGG
jgi:phage shock protein A